MPLNLRRFLTGVLAVLVLILVTAAPAEAAQKKKKQARLQRPDRYAAVVIEATTGYVLSAQNPDKKLYPASLTKMMTLYLTFDALAAGQISKNQHISVSRRAAAQEPSSLGLTPGSRIRIEDAILSIATKSANDASVALAEAVGGSEAAFARAMTIKARQLGMANTQFVNASGLFNRSQYSTARDMAILSRALIRDHANYYRYFSTSAFTYKDETYINHNKLMSNYAGMDGIKTGYVYASGYNLAASAVQGGTRLIGVIFGGRTARSRNDAMAKLLNQSFTRISDIRVAELVGKGGSRTAPVAARRRPAKIQSLTEVAAADHAPAAAELSAPLVTTAAGDAVDQGDTDIFDDNTKAVRIIRGTPPVSTTVRPLRTAAKGTPGIWTIQIGAFSSREASLRALEAVRASLQGLVQTAEATAAPLMTKRGMVYRARLSGLDRSSATQACSILKGTCLVLTAE